MQYLVSQVLFPLLHVLLVPRLDQLHHPPHGPAPGHLHRLLADLLLVVIEHLLHNGNGGLASSQSALTALVMSVSRLGSSLYSGCSIFRTVEFP